MALTKTQAAVDAWAEVAQDAVREGATIDVSGNYAHLLNIDLAINSAIAHTGTEVIVQISSSDADDEFWTELVKFISITGTANEENIDDNPLAATATTITISDTTGYAENGKLRFLEDSGAIANSELVYQTDFTTNTDIDIIDGVKREHATASNLYSLAQTYLVTIPMSAERIRVIINNTYDPDGSTVATRTRISQVTGI